MTDPIPIVKHKDYTILNARQPTCLVTAFGAETLNDMKVTFERTPSMKAPVAAFLHVEAYFVWKGMTFKSRSFRDAFARIGVAHGDVDVRVFVWNGTPHLGIRVPPELIIFPIFQTSWEAASRLIKDRRWYEEHREAHLEKQRQKRAETAEFRAQLAAERKARRDAEAARKRAEREAQKAVERAQREAEREAARRAREAERAMEAAKRRKEAEACKEARKEARKEAQRQYARRRYYRDRERILAAQSKYRAARRKDAQPIEEDDNDERLKDVPTPEEMWRRCLERRRTRFEEGSDYYKELDEIGGRRG